MPDSSFRKRGLKVVVDTTEQAEFDFALHRISPVDQERIATNLKAMPSSPRDQHVGSVRIREAIAGWDVAFVITPDGHEIVVLVIGIDGAGALESQFELLGRAAIKSLPPGAQELLKGRRKKGRRKK